MNVVIHRSEPVELIEIGHVVLAGIEDAVAKVPVPCTVLETRNTVEGIELFVRRVGLGTGKRTVLRAKRGDQVDVELSAEQCADVLAALRACLSDDGYLVGLGLTLPALAEYRDADDDTVEGTDA
jgi:hypothetical protein